MIRKFETDDEEILTILAEECAELIQEIMKMKRKDHYRSEIFEQEVGDVLALISLAEEYGLFDKEKVLEFTDYKKHKLEKWSSFYNKED